MKDETFISKGPSDGNPSGASSREENTNGSPGGASGSLSNVTGGIKSKGTDGSIWAGGLGK